MKSLYIERVTIVKQIEAVIGTSIVPQTVHEVRDVAPKKMMMCVSFMLPSTIAYSSSSPSTDNKRKSHTDKSPQDDDNASNEEAKKHNT